VIVRSFNLDLPYALGTGAVEARQPVVIDGDLNGFRKVSEASASAQKSKQFVLGYAEEDKPSRKELIEDVRALLQLLARGKSHLDLAYVAVLHHEAAGDQVGDQLAARKRRFRYAIHLFVAEVDLLTGKRIQLFYGPADGQRLWAWLTAYNLERGYACPSEAHRAKPCKPRWSQKMLNENAQLLGHVSMQRLSHGTRITPKEWAMLLKPHANGGRIECYPTVTTLVAKIFLPGLESAQTIRLARDGALKVRAARSNVAPRPANSGNKPPSIPRYETIHHTQYPDGVTAEFRPNEYPAPTTGSDRNPSSTAGDGHRHTVRIEPIPGAIPRAPASDRNATSVSGNEPGGTRAAKRNPPSVDIEQDPEMSP